MRTTFFRHNCSPVIAHTANALAAWRKISTPLVLTSHLLARRAVTRCPYVAYGAQTMDRTSTILLLPLDLESRIVCEGKNI
eukprot:SAG11_NODE_3089_length_2702_cov_3.781022_5_plen_81_part_00